MPVPSEAQNARLLRLLEAGTMLRASKLREAGINPHTISRAVEAGEIERIGRGIYQKLGAEVEEGQILAEAALKVPKGIVALVSALAFHDLTD